jgi:hypothetical protein
MGLEAAVRYRNAQAELSTRGTKNTDKGALPLNMQRTLSLIRSTNQIATRRRPHDNYRLGPLVTGA